MCRKGSDTVDAIRYLLRSTGAVRPPTFGGIDDTWGRFGDVSLSIDTDVDDRADTYARPDVGKAYEMSFEVDQTPKVVETLREDAGHEFMCDGFDDDTFRDAIHAVESAGFTEARWYLPPDVVDAVREWYDVRDRTDAPSSVLAGVWFKFPIWEAPEDAFGADAFLVADRAVTTPPDAIAALDNPVLVRETSGIARIDTDAGFEWGPSE